MTNFAPCSDSYRGPGKLVNSPDFFCQVLYEQTLGKYCCRYSVAAPCWLWGCKDGPTLFPGWMSYKATKTGLVSVLYLSMFFIVLVFIRAPFLCTVSFHCMCSVFWLF